MQIIVLVTHPLLKAKTFTFFLSAALYEIQDNIYHCVKSFVSAL